MKILLVKFTFSPLTEIPQLEGICARTFPDDSRTLEFNSDGRAGDVRFRSIPTPTPPGGSYVGGMVVKGVSKDCIFNEDFGNVFKSAIGALVYKLR